MVILNMLNGNYLSTLQYLYNNLATIDEQVLWEH